MSREPSMIDCEKRDCVHNSNGFCELPTIKIVKGTQRGPRESVIDYGNREWEVAPVCSEFILIRPLSHHSKWGA
jgi:hypothetical protein